MGYRRLRVVAVVVLCVAGAARLAAAVTPAPAKTPTQAFLDYHAAASKATTLADVLPHLSKEYRAMLESRPKADHTVWVGRLKDATVKDLKVTKETITGDKATLEATGKSAKGNAVTGKIMLVREAGVWKLDEQFWAT